MSRPIKFRQWYLGQMHYCGLEIIGNRYETLELLKG